LALARFGVAAREPARALQKAWSAYRKTADLICMAMPRRQNPLDSHGARTPMNGEPRTDLIELITRTGSLSGDDDLAPARPTLIRRHFATFRSLAVALM
jgi:hypothetical protein